MVSFEVNAEQRQDMGKGASRRLRKTGMIPAIIYGTEKEPINLSLKHSEVMRHLEDEAFYSHLLNVNINGTTESVILKDVQRHPYKASVLHMDFLRVDENRTLHAVISLHFLNTEECVGVKTGGGALNPLLKEIEVICLPKDLPEFIQIDVEALELGGAIHLSDLTLPEGVSILALSKGNEHDHDQAVITVRKLKGSILDEDDAPVVVDDAAEAETDSE